MRKLSRRAKNLFLLALLPVCINMGIKEEQAKTSTKTKEIINVTETKEEPTTKEVKALIHISTTDNVVTNTNNAVDWTKLGNVLPILDSNETITIDPELQAYIYNTSLEFDVPYELTLSVCYIESKFNANVNNAGLNSDGTTDYGIMGLNDLYLPNNCDLYNNGIIIDPYNPYENIYIGVQILESNLRYFEGNVYDAANAYNLGPCGWENMKYSGQSWYYGDTVLEYISALRNTLNTDI